MIKEPNRNKSIPNFILDDHEGISVVRLKLNW